MLHGRDGGAAWIMPIAGLIVTLKRVFIVFITRALISVSEMLPGDLLP